MLALDCDEIREFGVCEQSFDVPEVCPGVGFVGAELSCAVGLPWPGPKLVFGGGGATASEPIGLGWANAGLRLQGDFDRVHAGLDVRVGMLVIERASNGELMSGLMVGAQIFASVDLVRIDTTTLLVTVQGSADHAGPLWLGAGAGIGLRFE